MGCRPKTLCHLFQALSGLINSSAPPVHPCSLPLPPPPSFIFSPPPHHHPHISAWLHPLTVECSECENINQLLWALLFSITGDMFHYETLSLSRIRWNHLTLESTETQCVCTHNTPVHTKVVQLMQRIWHSGCNTTESHPAKKRRTQALWSQRTQWLCTHFRDDKLSIMPRTEGISCITIIV